MKRTEEFCDVCGKQVSYRDGDLDQYSDGIRLFGIYDLVEHKRAADKNLTWQQKPVVVEKPLRIRLSAHIRRGCGYSSGMMPDFGGIGIVCSPNCLERAFGEWLQKVREGFR